MFRMIRLLGFCILHVLLLSISGTPIKQGPSCHIENIPVQANLDMTKMEGYWYNVRGTENIVYGWSTWNSHVWNIVVGEDGTSLLVFRAYSKDKNKCSTTMVEEITNLDTLQYGYGISKFKIVYTDYNVAVVYYCKGTNITVQCPDNKLQVYVWSRTTQALPSDRVTELQEYVSLTCEDPEHLIDSQPGKCDEPYFDQKYATSNLITSDDHKVFSVNGSPGSTAVLSCTFKDVSDSKVMFLSPDQTLISYGNRIMVDGSGKYTVTQLSNKKYKLHINNVQSNDEGIYKCISGTQPARKIALTLVESTSILEFGSTGDLQVTEGEDSKFYCNVNGYPTPNITWYYTRDTDSSDQSAELDQTGPTLELKDIQKSMAGKYTCMADNGYPPFSLLDMFLSVDFAPVISLPNTHVGQILERDVILECTVQAEPFPDVFWSYGGKRIPSDGDRIYVDVYQDTVDTMTLSLNIRDLMKEDLGIYTCSASNEIGTSVKHMKLYEINIEKNRCAIDNIHTHEVSNPEKCVGIWHRIKATKSLYADNTYISEVINIKPMDSTHYVMSYRGYSPLTENCVAPGAIDLYKIRSGMFSIGDTTEKAIYKIVYSDCEYAVIYQCMDTTGDYEECPAQSTHVEILSKHLYIPEDKLQYLELIVTDMCINVNDMMTTVPGLCHFPESFAADHSITYSRDESKCYVDKLHGVDNLDFEKFAGLWYPIAGSKAPFQNDYTQPAHFILDKTGRLNFVNTPYSKDADGCLTTLGNVMTLDEDHRWFKFHLLGVPVSIRIIYTDYTNTVMYTCAGVDENGLCLPDKTMIRILSKNPTIPLNELRRLKKYAVDACFDVNKMKYISTGITKKICEAPNHILQSVRAGEITEQQSSLPLGCKLEHIPVAPYLNPQRVSGKHYTVYTSSHIPLDNQHGPIYISTTTTGSLFIINSNYNDKSKTCEPPVVMVVSPDNPTGDYSLDRRGAHVISRLVYISDDNRNAVLYKCYKVNSDGYCDPNYQFASILSNDKTMSEEKKIEIFKVIMNKCIDVKKLRPVVAKEKECTVSGELIEKAKTANLPIGVTKIGCLYENIPAMNDYDMTKVAGEWNVILQTNNIPRYKTTTSAVGNLIITDNHELFMVRRRFNRAWKACQPTVVVKLYPGKTKASFIAYENQRTLHVKLIYTDYTNAVFYMCYSILSDGTCDPKALLVIISSRKTALGFSELHQFQQYITTACIKYDDMVFSAPGHCPIPDKIITGVQNGEVSQDYSLPLLGCDGHIIPVQDNLNTSKLLGDWNHLYRPSTFMRRPTAQSKISHLLPIKGGLLKLWRGYNDTTGLCRPTEAGAKYEASGPGDYYYAAPHFPVMYKIIWTDYIDAVTLSCYGVGLDGKCSPGRSLIEIMSRNSDEVASLDVAFDKVTQACGKISSLGKKSSGLCTIPPSLIDSATSGEVTEDYTVVQCKEHLIPVQDGFKFDRFVGNWNVLKKTVYISGETSTISHQRYIIHTNNGELLSLEKGYSPDPVNSQPTAIRKLNPADRPGHYTTIYHNRTVTFKVIYTDYTDAVVYLCMGVGKDKTCLHQGLQIEIWSRHDSISTEKFGFLRHYVADACAEVDDLTDITPGVCKIPNDILQAAQMDQVHVHGEDNDVECKVQFIHYKKNFDEIQFEGVWHTLASTNYLFKNNSWTSAITNYVHDENGHFFVAYRGFAPYLNKCTRTSALELVEWGKAGNYSASSVGSVKVMIKVVATDYINTAIIYTCVHVNQHGDCTPDKDNIELAARDPNTDWKTVLNKYHQEIQNLCIKESDIIPKQTNLCETPFYVGNRCRLSEIKIEENFIILQLIGLWFQQSRTRFTQFNKFESSTFFYSYDRENDLIRGKFTGTINGVCQSPVSSVTKPPKDGPPGNMLGKMGDPDSIYPWIKFRVVYFDGFNIVFYACYHENQDGTCMNDQIEVSVFGRTHDMGDKLKSVLPGLMSRLCLSESDLSPVTHVDCLHHINGKNGVSLTAKSITPELPDVSKCKLKDVRTPSNIKTHKILGIWYGIASVDYGIHSSHPTDGFIIRIAILTGLSFKIHRQQDRNGTCQIVSDVIAKPVCSSSTTGDYVSSTGSSLMTQWSRLKILYIDDSAMLLYWCQQENSDGNCNIEGVRVDLLSRTPELDYIIPLQAPLESVCLEHKNLINVETSSQSACHPETLPPPPSPPPIMPISSCAVDLLPKTDINMTRIAGYWYEIASQKPEPLFPLTNLVLYYHPLESEHIKMIFSGKTSNGDCQDVVYGDFKTRCLDKPDGRYLGRLNMKGMWTWNTIHVLYTDYDHVTIVYSCFSEREDGSCKPAAAKAHILSRTTTLDAARRKRMDNIILSACLAKLEDNIEVEINTCKPKVADALENLKTKMAEGSQ